MGVLANLRNFLRANPKATVRDVPEWIGGSGGLNQDFINSIQYAALDAARRGENIEDAMRKQAKTGLRYDGPMVREYYSPSINKYETGDGMGAPTGYTVSDWQELQGPVDPNKRIGITEDEAMELIGGNNGDIMKRFYGDAKADDEAYLNMLKQYPPGIDLRNAEIRMQGLKDAYNRLFPDMGQVRLDPQMYTGDEFAPWVKNAAKKYINGED